MLQTRDRDIPLTMPRPSVAKQWKPNAVDKGMIDTYTRYAVISERAAEHLRSLNFSDKRRWAQVQADFQSHPNTYPSVMANIMDEEGRKQFLSKCEAICFPQKPSSRPEECV
jgi:hypothetical protein